MGQVGTRAGTVLRILCAVVLLSLVFAPHASPLAASVTVLGEEYRLPDGSFPELCEEHRHSDPAHQNVLRCEICLLCASAMLPAPDNGHWLLTKRQVLANPLRQVAAVEETRAIPAPRSRAPPALL
jgi:hypothetical protein